MLVPVLRRITENGGCFIERVFPVDGNLNVKVGDFVKPFEHLGECRFSQNEIVLPKNFKPYMFRNEKKFYYLGTLLGKSKSEKIYAPYDGELSVSKDKNFVFSENEKKYLLLAGVWGKVKSIYDKRSVLIETKAKDILLSASTTEQVSGELVVFPNPTDVLKKSYLENFAKNILGKIIYIGDSVGLDVIERAYEMGASAVIVGSADREVFDFAKNAHFAFGIFSGFGKIRTPESVYKLLSSVPYRYVFFEGDKNILKVPVEINEDTFQISTISSSNFGEKVMGFVKSIDVGMNVQVLQEPYFGWVGTVDRVSESSIFVKFGIEKTPVEIRLPNFLIVE